VNASAVSQKGTSALKALAEELKTDEGTMSYADRMAQELAELLQAEEDRAAKEIERRQVRFKAIMSCLRIPRFEHSCCLFALVFFRMGNGQMRVKVGTLESRAKQGFS